MKCLILSCNTGEGHNAAGLAVKEAMELNGHQADMFDYLTLAGQKTSDIVGGAYINIAKYMPRFFGFIYNIGMFISSDKHKSPVYYANALMADRLYAYIQEHDYDIVIMPHLYPAETITYMKEHYDFKIPAIAIGTDYTCIPFWEETNLDAYVIPDPSLVPEYVRRGVRSDILYPYGIPVRRAFVSGINKSRARHILHLNQNSHVYLVMGGSMGFGRMQVFVYELYKACDKDEQIVVICGNNNRLRRRLKREFGNISNIHITGYTDKVSWYMDAADVVFTKPGGLSSTEACVKNIPIVHTNGIPGCETKNRQFFTHRGMSYASKKIRTQVAMGKALARKGACRNEMLRQQRIHMRSDAAQEICNLAEKMIEGE